ncbi:DUF4123 domain-containing protein [Pseudomonas sp. P8_241]|uniref:DUF4123 domain-containing protein n=1 Tax=Pseudomonas sp. P8_241 TaxID=3043445 RepID=UPI002A35DC85|nr:DUF4123 domain-containing protein [Pseudomonas sp. P8_241]WPN47796.1 DUF4123 domain-containing protein [Pseudomonas sp. P8_241]
MIGTPSTRDSPPQWLLLDTSAAVPATEILRQVFAQARWFWLFEGTEWQAQKTHGPVLVDLMSCPVLTDLCDVDGQRWRGLLMVSDVSVARLLAHLRRMLTVTFGLHRAMLSYYNPNTASYFFDACDAAELSRWLGPISQIRWFGGTWADRAMGCEGWQCLHNPGLAVRPLAIEEDLSAGQQGKLQTCLLEQYAWRWSRATSIEYRDLWAKLQEGLALGFSQRAVLDDWLTLRLQHPGAVSVQPLTGRTQQERLDHLRRLWQRDQ